MAAQATLTLTDAESTPVNRAFIPYGVDGDGVAVWKYLAAGNPGIATCVASMSLRDPVPGSDTYKATLKLMEPILEAVAGSTPAGYTPSPKVAYKDLAVIDIIVSGRASQQNRKNILAMLRDFLGESIVTSLIHDFERPW